MSLSGLQSSWGGGGGNAPLPTSGVDTLNKLNGYINLTSASLTITEEMPTNTITLEYPGTILSANEGTEIASRFLDFSQSPTSGLTVALNTLGSGIPSVSYQNTGVLSLQTLNGAITLVSDTIAITQPAGTTGTIKLEATGSTVPAVLSVAGAVGNITMSATNGLAINPTAANIEITGAQLTAGTGISIPPVAGGTWTIGNSGVLSVGASGAELTGAVGFMAKSGIDITTSGVINGTLSVENTGVLSVNAGTGDPLTGQVVIEAPANSGIDITQTGQTISVSNTGVVSVAGGTGGAQLSGGIGFVSNTLTITSDTQTNSIKLEAPPAPVQSLTAGTGITVGNSGGDWNITNTGVQQITAGGTVFIGGVDLTSASLLITAPNPNTINLEAPPAPVQSLTAGTGIDLNNTSGVWEITNTGVQQILTGGTSITGGVELTSIGDTITITVPSTGVINLEAPPAPVQSVSGGTGITVSNTAGDWEITNTGVQSVGAGTGISVINSGGTYTVENTGVITVAGGTGATPISGAIEILNNGVGIEVSTTGQTIGIENTGVVSLGPNGNPLTGAIEINGAGSGIQVSASGSVITVENTGVLSVAGGTGATPLIGAITLTSTSLTITQPAGGNTINLETSGGSAPVQSLVAGTGISIPAPTAGAWTITNGGITSASANGGTTITGGVNFVGSGIVAGTPVGGITPINFSALIPTPIVNPGFNATNLTVNFNTTAFTLGGYLNLTSSATNAPGSLTINAYLGSTTLPPWYFWVKNGNGTNGLNTVNQDINITYVFGAVTGQTETITLHHQTTNTNTPWVMFYTSGGGGSTQGGTITFDGWWVF